MVPHGVYVSQMFACCVTRFYVWRQWWLLTPASICLYFGYYVWLPGGSVQVTQIWWFGLVVWKSGKSEFYATYTIKYELLFVFCFVILNTNLFWFVGFYFYLFLNYFIYFLLFHLFSPMFIYVHLFSIFIYCHLLSSISSIFIYLSIYLSFFLCFFLCFFLSFVLSFYLSIYRSIYLSICLSICLSVCLSNYL